MSYALPETDTVYVDHLPTDVNEEEIAEYFGSIGRLKKDKRTRTAKIWLYKDKRTGDLKGDATVTYEDPFAAQSAVDWFDKKDFRGSTLHVSLATRKNDGDDGGRMGGRGGYNRRSGDRGRGSESSFMRQPRNEGHGDYGGNMHNSYNSRPNPSHHSDGPDRRYQQRGGGGGGGGYPSGSQLPRDGRSSAPSQPPMSNPDMWVGDDRGASRQGRGGYSDSRGWGAGGRGRGRGRDYGDRRGGRGEGGWGNRRSSGRYGDDRRPPRDFRDYGGRDHEGDERGGNWRDSRGPQGRERTRSPDRRMRNSQPQRDRSKERSRHQY